jgi:hypothetical protein
MEKTKKLIELEMKLKAAKDARTAQMRKELFPYLYASAMKATKFHTETEDKASAKKKEVLALTDNLGCQADTVRAILSRITDTDYTKMKADKTSSLSELISKVPRFAIIVPTDNHNSHNYTIGSPIMVIKYTAADPGSEDKCMCSAEKEFMPGNHMGDHFRYATKEEAEDFLAPLKELEDGSPLMRGLMRCFGNDFELL